MIGSLFDLLTLEDDDVDVGWRVLANEISLLLSGTCKVHANESRRQVLNAGAVFIFERDGATSK